VDIGVFQCQIMLVLGFQRTDINERTGDVENDFTVEELLKLGIGGHG